MNRDDDIEVAALKINRTSWYLVLGPPLAIGFLTILCVAGYIYLGRMTHESTPEEKRMERQEMCFTDARRSYENCMRDFWSRTNKCAAMFKEEKEDCSKL